MLALEVVTPERCLFKINCISVTLPGKSGEFQVLKGHTAMLAGLRTGILSFNPNGSDKTLKNLPFSLNNFRLMITNGFVEISDDSVIVLCDFAVLPNEVDAISSRKQVIRLKKKLEKLNKGLDKEFCQIEAELEQTVVKLLLVS